MGEDEVDPNHDFIQLMAKQDWYKNDIKLSMKHQLEFVNKDSRIYEKGILKEERFK
jgi:hypothetical protein